MLNSLLFFMKYILTIFFLFLTISTKAQYNFVPNGSFEIVDSCYINCNGIGTSNPTSKLQVLGGDIRVGINTSQGVILTSPNGTKYRLIVDNSGALSTVVVP